MLTAFRMISMNTPYGQRAGRMLLGMLRSRQGVLYETKRPNPRRLAGEDLLSK